MKTLLKGILATLAIAMFTINSYSQVSLTVVQGETRTYTVAPQAGSVVPTYNWTLSSGGNLTANSPAANQAQVEWTAASGTHTLTMTPTVGTAPNICTYTAKTASITILPNTIDIAWGTITPSVRCSQETFTLPVTAVGFSFTAGTSYDIEFTDGITANQTAAIIFTGPTTNGTVDLHVHNTSSADITAITITGIRVSGGSWLSRTHATGASEVVVHPEPVLDNITSN